LNQDQVDQEKMGLALQRLEGRSSFRVHTIKSPVRHYLRDGRAALEIIVDRMKREFKWTPMSASPGAYRETIRATVESEGKFVRQSGGRGQYGHGG